MDRLSSRGDDFSDDFTGAPESNRVDVDGGSTADASGQSFLQHDPELEAETFTARPDIDTAMVEALRNALAPDHGSPRPGWEASERDRLGDMRRSPDLGSLTWGPPDLVRRCDIDLAMLDALHQAMGPDPEVSGA